MFKQRVLFHVSNAKCKEMIQSLSQEDDAWTEEVKHLSRSWIKAIMAQPYTKNKSIRRPFHYSKKKLSSYLAWRKECNLTEEMSYYMKCEDKFHFKFRKTRWKFSFTSWWDLRKCVTLIVSNMKFPKSHTLTLINRSANIRIPENSRSQLYRLNSPVRHWNQGGEYLFPKSENHNKN